VEERQRERKREEERKRGKREKRGEKMQGQIVFLLSPFSFGYTQTAAAHGDYNSSTQKN
jgi:hypothetical protein